VAILPLRECLAFEALAQHHSKLRDRHLRELFAEEPTHGERVCAGLYLDYSKNRITDETLGVVVQLAEQSELERRRDMIFAGARINVSENRPALHVALRMPKGESLIVDGVDVVAEVHEVLDRMANSPPRSARVPGRVTPASRSGTSPISASARPTWGR
jgi:glucose-6-phosphate isomerase